MNIRERYHALAHAVQTGIAHLMHHDPALVEPKHLRVGINLRAADHAGLVKLLIDKGLFTEQEYGEALIAQLEIEVTDTETQVARALGSAKVTLR